MNDISKNDLRGIEAMLYSQAQVRHAVFVDALLQVPKQEWFSNSEAYMRMELKAQSQCRTTLEVLTAIKNPPVVFARQANIAQGSQQVNNQMMPTAEPRVGARETEKPQNELLEEKPDEPLDTEHRARQSALICTWRPWEKTTGPKTPQGKAKASRNVYKGGTRAILRALARLQRVLEIICISKPAFLRE